MQYFIRVSILAIAVTSTWPIGSPALGQTRLVERDEFWAPPRVIKFPSTYVRESKSTEEEEYCFLSEGTLLAKDEWFVCLIHHVAKDQNPNTGAMGSTKVGRLAVNLRNGEQRFLALPLARRGYEYEFGSPFYEFPGRLAESTYGVALKCKLTGMDADDEKLPPKELLWSWNVSDGSLIPIGNNVFVEQLMEVLDGTPFGVRWFDREFSNWSGWVDIFRNKDGDSVGQIEVVKFFEKDGQRDYEPQSQFVTGNTRDKILRLSAIEVEGNGGSYGSLLECIDLSKGVRPAWSIGPEKSREFFGGSSRTPWLEFADGVQRPMSRVPVLAYRNGKEPAVELWLLDSKSGTFSKRYHLRHDEGSHGDRPFVSPNGKFVAVSHSAIGLKDDRRLVVIDLDADKWGYDRPFPYDQKNGFRFLCGITADGAMLFQTHDGIYSLAPPYSGPEKTVFELPLKKEE